VNFLMVNLMQGVLRSGTGARVWSYGFNLPAAGKTGTSHDAWFAGFTTKLLCIVWVGLDDYQDLKMDGARAALPVWAEFMKAAHKHRAYRDVTDFAVPDGVVSAQVDPESGLLATSACPKVTTDYYILGTQPVQFCPLHQGGATEIASWGDAARGASANPPNIPIQPGAAPLPPAFANVPPGQPFPNASKQNQPKPAKHGFFDKFKSIFK
jgi:penicillin-binding protein 1B